MCSERLQVAAVVGPTAVGKTSASLALASTLEAEIVSIDSMQIYRGMDIGTAKPSRRELARVRHHLIDIAEPSAEVTVAEFQQEARSAIEDVSARGRLPLLVGGSGLYFRAVVDDLVFPPRAREVRGELEAEAEREGVRALHERLRALDPVAAARIEPSNARRIVRALEVIEVTGEPFSANATWDTYESIYELCVAGLVLPRAELYARVALRVDRMLEAGLSEEVRLLAEKRLSNTARQALGYRQFLEASEGEDPRDEIVRATKRFARRQESWFRQDPRITWFDASAQDLPALLAEHFRGCLRLP